MSRAKAEEAWRSRVARHEDNLITQTDDLIAEGIRAFVDYRRAIREGNQNRAAEEYSRLTDLVERIKAHPLMVGTKPDHEIRRSQYLCLAFFVNRNQENLTKAEEIAHRLVGLEEGSSPISLNAQTLLVLIQDLRG